MSHIVWLDECRAGAGSLVGGKAVGLGSLCGLGHQVPPGFAVTTDAYRRLLRRGGFLDEIRGLLAGADRGDARQRAAQQVRALFDEARLDDDVAAEIATAYGRLGDDPPVAVRSSATAEDLKDASFAGQQETYLWVQGAEAVARHVLRCWGSLFTPQAIAYRRRLGVPLDGLAMAVVVQEMVPAEAAGVMMTIDPVTGDRSQVLIESAFGLGRAVVDGEVTPDRFFVDKVTLKLRDQVISPKAIAYRLDPSAGEVRAATVRADQQLAPSLQADEVVRVAELGKAVERALGQAQDIEWAVAPGPSGPRQVFLLQTRPETVWSQRPSAPVAAAGTSVLDRMMTSMRGPTTGATAFENPSPPADVKH